MWSYELVRTTTISNQRLSIVLLILRLIVFSAFILHFVLSRKYTEQLANDTSVALNHPNIHAYRRWFAAVPNKNGSAGFSWNEYGDAISVEYPAICLPDARKNDALNKSCLYGDEVVSLGDYYEARVVLGLVSVSHGEQLRMHGINSDYEHKIIEQYAAYPFNLTYTIQLRSTVSTFVAGLNNGIRRNNLHLTAFTVVLDREGSIWKKYMPSIDIILTPAEILWTAAPIGGEKWLLNEVSASSTDELFGTPEKFPAWVQDQGADIGGFLQCFNDDYDAHDVQIGDLVHSGSPVCILQFKLYKPRLRLPLPVKKSKGLHTRSNQITFRVRITGSTGVFRAWDFSAILMQAVSMMVLIKLPAIIMRFITLNLLGHLSVIYKRSAVCTFNVTEQCGAMAAKLLQSVSTFQQLANVQADDRNEKPAISWDTLQKSLSMTLQASNSDLDDAEIAELSNFCFKSICATSQSQANVNDAILRDDYGKACLFNEAIDLAGIIKLFDANRRRSPLESFFTPAVLRRSLRASLQVQSALQDLAEVKSRRGSIVCHGQAHSMGDECEQSDPTPSSWQDVCDTKLQELTEELLAVRHELHAVSVKISLMENENQQLTSARELAMARASINNGAPCESKFTPSHESQPVNLPLLRETSESMQKGLTDVQESASQMPDMEDVKTKQAGEVESKMILLEMSVQDLRKALLNLEMKQASAIQEAVSTAFSRAWLEFNLLKDNLSAAAAQLHDAEHKLEMQTGFLKVMMEGKAGLGTHLTDDGSLMNLDSRPSTERSEGEDSSHTWRQLLSTSMSAAGCSRRTC